LKFGVQVLEVGVWSLGFGIACEQEYQAEDESKSPKMPGLVKRCAATRWTTR
jgi:hypothetical protein